MGKVPFPFDSLCITERALTYHLPRPWHRTSASLARSHRTVLFCAELDFRRSEFQISCSSDRAGALLGGWQCHLPAILIAARCIASTSVHGGACLEMGDPQRVRLASLQRRSTTQKSSTQRRHTQSPDGPRIQRIREANTMHSLGRL